MGVKEKVRTDLDLHKESILEIGMYAIERSYPKEGVGQIWKQYLKQLKTTMHTFENLNIVLTRTPTQTPTRTPTRTPTDADANAWVTT